jgi:hypothetical protein
MDVRAGRATTVARVAVAIVALLIVAWLAVLVRDQQVGHAGVQSIIDRPDMGERDWNRALDQMRAADLLDPSTDWSMGRANYLMVRDPERARLIAESVVRREPNNLAAWMVILRATRETEPERARQAERHILRLNPPIETSR